MIDPTEPEQDTSGGRDVSLILLIPNMVTLMGLSFGLTGIRFAMEGYFTWAVILIMLSALADLFDGLLARRLGAQSEMGAQLDSLSDFLCFGVAPAILVYEVHLGDFGGLGWIFALIFAVSACLRLARFNVMSGQAEPGEAPKRYFVGVPAPAGAFLGLFPVFLSNLGLIDPGSAPLLVCVWLAVVGALMISNLKTPSPKGVKVPRRMVAVLFFATVIAMGLIFTRPWLLLVIMDAAYLAVIMVALVRAKGRLFG
ncbi:CDP-diacylglycerol--serine O-phosphatidyltransferase [Sagittula sp. NFXS13]|uniref:CDP-diacylglycerol--serine O-phosphatidyltransferase n=1 Tax=Sagittula marina TaxID=943940 RepID=A0A7W6DIK4_9RHOB|nr:CDP-diacylglycerol--serine O-phosphatidyltransferase [Sagittula marina]MBB3983950.1 CDP-diacylglycerol--serine O-phosphatidyltransferase [Sagittula marina]